MWTRNVAVSGPVILLAALAAACSDVPPTQPPRPLDAPLFSVQDPFASQTPLVHAHLQGLDAEFAQVAREIPGFGGMFYDDEGNLNVYLAPTPRVQPLAATAVASTLGGRLRAWGKDAAQAHRLIVREGQYDFLQLSAWHQRVLPIFSMVEGVVFTDADEAHNRLRIGIEKSVSRAQVEAALAQLGIPREAVIIEVTEPIVPMSGHTLQDQVRPVAGGLQINFPGSFCTLGFNVRVPGIKHDFFIVNAHCTQVRGEVTGTPYWQNASWVENSSIGVEVYDPPFFTGGLCPAGWRCRFSDAAGASYDRDVSVRFGRIYRTRFAGTTAAGSLEIDEHNPQFRIVEEVSFPLAGETVSKMGRTTGWTTGRVGSTCVWTSVIGTNILMICQAWVAAAVAPGDSGSPVFQQIGTGNRVRLYGILWGGSNQDFAFSPMGYIRSELGGPWRTF